MSELIGQWGDIAKATVLVLLDFSWQSSVLIAMVFGGMKLFRVRSASTRYLLLVCTLFGVGVLPLVNLGWIYGGVSRFSIHSMKEKGGQGIQVIGHVVLRHGEDRSGKDQSEIVEQVSFSDMTSRQQQWLKMIVRSVGLHRYEILFGIWVSGVLFGVFRMLWGYRRLWRLKALSRPVEDTSILAMYEELLGTLHLQRKPRLLASNSISVPIAVGILDTVVLVPDKLAERLSSEKLGMVLIHELAHIKQHDLLIGLYQRLLKVIWFFHPLIQYLSGRIIEACEDRCDGLVLERTGEPTAYARTLMEILGSSDVYPKTPLFVAAGLHCRSRLALRIRGILEGIPMGHMPRGLILSSVFATGVLVGHLSSFTLLGGSEIRPVPENRALSGIVGDAMGSSVIDAKVLPLSEDAWGAAMIRMDERLASEGLMQITADTTDEYNPSWSPDGTRMAFASWRTGNEDIWVKDLTTGELTQITSYQGMDVYPTWSPDGTRIAFLSDRSGSWNIWVKDLTTGASTRTTPHVKAVGWPSWSPDGTRIAFGSGIAGNFDIWAKDLVTGGFIQITTHLADEFFPDWSPDAGKVVFQSFRTGNWDIWVKDLISDELVQVTTDPAGDYVPGWSSDGTKIAFHSTRTGNRDIWVKDLITGELTQIAAHPAEEQGPRWSPDDTKIAFYSEREGNGDIWICSTSSFEGKRASSPRQTPQNVHQ